MLTTRNTALPAAAPSALLPLAARLPPELTAVQAFRRLAHLPHVVFFDSAATNQGSAGRYSFVAAEPFAWIESGPDGADPLADAERLWRQFRTPTRSDLPPFQGGLAGLLGYELARTLERVPAAAIDDLPTPALALGAYDVVLAFDHAERRAWIISQGWPERDEHARRERAASRLARFRELLTGDAREARSHTEIGRGAQPQVDMPNPSADLGVTNGNGAPTPLGDLAPQFDVGLGEVTSNLSAAAYRGLVRRAVEFIHAGDVFQVNLAQRLLCRAAAAPLDLYLRLREHNPAPYAAYFDLGKWKIASASPECFLTVRSGQVETRPIKGTRGRFAHPAADLFLGDALRTSEKDRAENVMIVDLMRNDLSRVCEADSVHVDQLCRLETYAYVQHLVSVVRGQLRPECSPWDLLRAAFPGGSITGAPKVRAMEIIAELEPTARGPYCGSLLYLGFDGAMDASILIRTITAGRGWLQIPVGGGIVAQSDPADEYRETWHKARGMLKAVGEVVSSELRVASSE